MNIKALFESVQNFEEFGKYIREDISLLNLDHLQIFNGGQLAEIGWVLAQNIFLQVKVVIFKFDEQVPVRVGGEALLGELLLLVILKKRLDVIEFKLEHLRIKINISL